ITEIVVHEIVPMEYGDLLLERITPNGNMPLYWCDGILFSFTSMPLTRDIVREYMQGRIHWMEVHFSVMDNYMPVIEYYDNEYKATQKIRVFDISKSLLHKKLIKWVKGKMGILT
ncbi:MAG: hypothetical protein QW478_15690, partial [Candidatus Micrarchaeaceae archaeon]